MPNGSARVAKIGTASIPGLGQPGEHAADFVGRIGERRTDRFAGQQQILFKVPQRGGFGNEGVRFLQQCDDADFHG